MRMDRVSEAILNHPLVRNGTGDDIDTRRDSLSKLNLPPVFDHFNAANQEVYAPENAENTEQLQSFIDKLPKGVGAFLYNSGATHFLIPSDAKLMTEQSMNLNPENWGDTTVGTYMVKFNSVVSKLENGGGTEVNVLTPETPLAIYHEAAHSLSHKLNSYDSYVEPISSALERDLEKLTNEQLTEIQSSFDIPSVFLEEVQAELSNLEMARATSDGDNMSSRHIATINVINDLSFGGFTQEQREYFPETFKELDKIEFKIEKLSEGYPALSHHPDIKAAYDSDLKQLLSDSQNNDGPVRWYKGEPYIGEGYDKRDIRHYVPVEYGGDGMDYYEEAFAQIFEDIVLERDGENALATHFPQMRELIKNSVIGTLNNANEAAQPTSKLTPEVPREILKNTATPF